MNTVEAAQYLRLVTRKGRPDPYRVRTLVHQGRLPFYKPFGRLLFSKKELSIARQAEKDLLIREGEDMSWGNLVELREKAILGGDVFARRITLASLQDYKSLLNRHTDAWAKVPSNQVDKAMAWSLLEKVEQEQEQSLATKKKLRSAIDSVFNWGILSGKIRDLKELPTKGYLSLRKEVEKPPEILNLEEIKILLKSAKELDHPCYPIWAMALLTGMRSGILYVQENWTSKEGVGPTKGRYWRTTFKVVALLKINSVGQVDLPLEVKNDLTLLSQPNIFYQAHFVIQKSSSKNLGFLKN